MSTPDHSSFDSAGLGAALEIFASAHELPASVRGYEDRKLHGLDEVQRKLPAALRRWAATR